jgi:hypothetical protein
MANDNFKHKLDKNIIRIIDRYIDNGTITSTLELYENMNIKKQTIYRIKKGYTHFSYEHIYRLKKYLNVDSDEFFKIN